MAGGPGAVLITATHLAEPLEQRRAKDDHLLVQKGRFQQSIDATLLAASFESEAPSPGEPIMGNIVATLPDRAQLNTFRDAFGTGKKSNRHLDHIEPDTASANHHFDAEKRALAAQVERLQRLRPVKLNILEVMNVQAEKDTQHIVVRKRDHGAEKIVGPGANAIDRPHHWNVG